MKRIFLTICISGICACTYAQKMNNELKELINKSFTYYPRFAQLNQAVAVEADRVDLVRSARMPVVDATASYRYIHPVSEISIPAGDHSLSFNIMPNNNYNTGLNASYVLWDYGTVKANVERAKAALQYAKDNVEFNKAQMAYQVAQVYYNIVYLKKAIAIQDSVLSFLNANKLDTEIKLKHGDALKYDVLSIQSTIDQAQNAKIDLQNNLRKQGYLMEYSTGTSDNQGSEFDFSVPFATRAEDLLSESQLKNLDYKLLSDRILEAKAELNANEKGGKPALIASAGTGFTNGYTPDLDRFRYNYSAGLTLKVPIYEGGRNRKQVKLSESKLRESTLGLETLNNAYTKDIRQALSDMVSNTASIANARRQVEEAMEAQKLAQSRYRNGTGTNLELTNASTNVQQVLLSQLRYQYQLCLASLELARLTGGVYW